MKVERFVYGEKSQKVAKKLFIEKQLLTLRKFLTNKEKNLRNFCDPITLGKF